MKKINLTIRERLGIGTLLDGVYRQGGLDLKNLVLAGKVVEMLIVDEKERKKVKWSPRPDGNITWNINKDKGKEIEFSVAHIDLIKDVIKRKDEKKEFALTDAFIIDLAKKLDIEI